MTSKDVVTTDLPSRARGEAKANNSAQRAVMHQAAGSGILDVGEVSSSALGNWKPA
jgi:hypothetical protein